MNHHLGGDIEVAVVFVVAAVAVVEATSDVAAEPKTVGFVKWLVAVVVTSLRRG